MVHKTKDSLVSFLYELMRDHVPTGIVEMLVNENDAIACSRIDGWRLKNEHLARYAEEVAARLRHQTKETPKKEAVQSDEPKVEKKEWKKRSSITETV
jgi:hypothetical protein